MAKYVDLNDLKKKQVVKLDQNQPLIESSEFNLDTFRLPHSKIVSFYSENSSARKASTICYALAHSLAKDGIRTLVYDCDIHDSLSRWAFGLNIENNYSGNYDSFFSHLPAQGLPRSLYEQMMYPGLGKIRPAFAICNNYGEYVVIGDRRNRYLDSMIQDAESICAQMKEKKYPLSASFLFDLGNSKSI